MQDCIILTDDPPTNLNEQEGDGEEARRDWRNVVQGRDGVKPYLAALHHLLSQSQPRCVHCQRQQKQ